MKEKSLNAVLQAIANEAIPPGEVDLWPGVRQGWGETRTARPRRSLVGALRRAAVPALIVTGSLVIVLILVGPERALAALRGLIGYIPGVGIVDESAPIRVLSEPVSATREGVTVTVDSAILTADRTHLDVRIFGVPRAAYPDREDVLGCSQSAYLLLPDRTRRSGGMDDWQAIPQDVHAATLVLPCIPGTLPGTIPENWQLHLAFVPAPPGLTVFPVVELSPSPDSTEGPMETPTVPRDATVSFDRVVETDDGYILIGRFQPSAPSGERVQVTDIQLLDASGKTIPYTTPYDIQPPDVEAPLSGEFGFVFEFDGAGLSYPMSVEFTGVTISQADPDAETEFEFDPGPNPQSGQEWILNQELELAGHRLTVVSITAHDHYARRGYSFRFRTGPGVYGASVDIPGYTPSGGGGGGGGGLTDGIFFVDLGYAELPTGRLRITVTNLTVIGEAITWRGQWAPDSPRTDWPSTPTPHPGTCLLADHLEQLEPVPADLAGGGMALTYEQVSPDTWGLVLYNLDGSGRQVLVPGGTWGTLSPDGDTMAYPSSDGIHVIDLTTRAEKVFEQGRNGYDLLWSPDGKQIAFVGERADGVYLIGLDGSSRRRVTDQAYPSVAGWSPDNTKIYVAIPFTGGNAWKVREIDTATGKWTDLFTTENGTRKFLSPTLSPDGQWLAYRGTDNSSLYLIRLDGTDMHLLMTGVGQVIWSRSGWMGVTMLGPDPDQLLLVRPESCRAYLLPSIHGYLMALYIP